MQRLILPILFIALASPAIAGKGGARQGHNNHRTTSKQGQKRTVTGTRRTKPQNLLRGNSARVFKRFGKVYNFLTDHPLWYKQNLRLLDHIGPLSKKPTIVDLGAGTGVGTLTIAQKLGNNARVIGVDLVPTMTAQAKRYHQERHPNLKNVNFITRDATNLVGIKSNSVDAVVANSFLYLVPDPVSVLREARRVLRPGGRLVFMEPRQEGSFTKATLHAAKLLPKASKELASSARLAAAMTAWRVASGISGRRTLKELKVLFKEAGFKNLVSKPTLGGIGQHLIAIK